MSRTKLRISSLSKRFRTKDGIISVLDNINLEVKKGEFVCILGPSGCGKSTLFNIISGIDREDAGVIEIDGINHHNRRGRTGYMLQQPLLLPWRTSRDNVALGMEIKGTPGRKAREKADLLLAQFGLLPYSSCYPRLLSGGMKQKVSLLRTISFNSDLLLLDEPFGSLDALTRFELENYLLSIWKKLKLTVLFITHDIHEAVYLADRIFVFSRRPARIIQEEEIKIRRTEKLSRFSSGEISELEKELLELLTNRSL